MKSARGIVKLTLGAGLCFAMVVAEVSLCGQAQSKHCASI
jgi:hypothetical protein